MPTFTETATKYRVIPVIAIENTDDAVPLADALLEGGLPLAEITLRTDAAAEIIALLSEKRPELYVGAGTILSSENLLTAIGAGAKFGVAPGLNWEILRLAQAKVWKFVPGVCTPTEVQSAIAKKCDILKFFPAGAMGGIAMLKAIAAPFSHTGVRFVPTGGVNEANLADYLALPIVIACGGTWIATKNDIAEGNWKEITERCKRITKIVGV